MVLILTFLPARLLLWRRVSNKRVLRQFRGKPIVIVSNHKSALDVFLYLNIIHRKLGFITNPKFFEKRFFAWGFSKFHCTPIIKGKEISAVRHSFKVLEKNYAMLIYPEGRRVFETEDIVEFYNGAAFIAAKAGVPIVPMVMNRRPRFFRLTRVKFGEPISTEELQDRKFSKEELTEFTNKMRDTMVEMLEKLTNR